MRLQLREVARYLDLCGPDDRGSSAYASADGTVTGWSVDSRTIQPGDLFFALRGPNHNGHAYIDEVFRKGAMAVVVDEGIDGQTAEAGRILRVENVLQGLGRLAARARQRWGGRVVAITGSAGKTTTKDIIAEMLADGFRTAKNEGNLNNQIGVPLSLLRMDNSAEIAVIEMGMNHSGEIRALAEIARPETGVVTNVGWAHIENFDSIEGIAAAKRELIEALPANGTAVLNADDSRVAGWVGQASACPFTGQAEACPTVFYGLSQSAHIRAEDVHYLENGTTFRVGDVHFETSLTGRHNVSNLLAGIAVANVYGIEPARLTAKVRNFSAAKMRGERFHCGGVLVYNDCYNSNPDAVRAMLDVLRDTPARRRIAVLGEMLELGHWAEPLHREIGNYAALSGINVLVGIRGAACHMLDAAKRAGLRADAAFFFDEPAEAGRLARSLAQPGDAILFKGSRGVHVEKALQQFVGESDV
ncbi:MAG: UDP-N-acetylmuramoyl-tripeptide--D-alanyl-D-alanine ligase [Bryobacterales bacterium]|nr:UDP-N-acetylmuramoyl-tripeptide--D-alanyl-D-alanine ligase [Bryobacterales bacterium]